MKTPPTRRRLTYVMVASVIAAICSIAAVPRSQAAGTEDDSKAEADWCAAIPPGTGHPPINLTPVTVQLLQRAVEPVPATDGLIHLVYAAQVTNTQTTPADIRSVVPVDPLADFSPTGRNFVTDLQGRDVSGKVRLFVTQGDTPPDDGPEMEPPLAFTSHVPAGNSGLMFFDVTYTDRARIPRLLAHTITLAGTNGGPGTSALTNPVPVGCVPLAVVHPPLVGHGWTDVGGCCAFAAYHRDSVPPVNGILQAGLQFAIDFVQIGPNGSFCSGPQEALSSWWSYNSPILAAAPGVVVAVTDGLPDQVPVGTITGLTATNQSGNSIIEDIGSGRYLAYAHMKPGTIPAWVRKGAALRSGDPLGRIGNSGNSSAPHLHFQAMDSPSAADSTGLPFVFDSQLLEGRVPEDAGDECTPVPIDRTGAGLRRGLMPLRNQVFGYNLSR